MLKSSYFFTKIVPATLLMGMISSCACTDSRKPEVDNKKDKSDDVAMADGGAVQSDIKLAIANVKGIQDHQVNGTVTFTKVEGGIRVVATLEGLTPGKHGFHIHEFGDCGEGGTSAGAHFNPGNHKHGGPDSEERHVGDLGNIEANKDGIAHYERVDKLIALEGENSIIGRSVIIHADPDDFISQPAGNSGARIGCGIIEPPRH